MSERNKDAEWAVVKEADGRYSTPNAQICVLQDIRDELKRLNSLLHCKNFVEIPYILRSIRCNTAKPQLKRKA
jgi:hypothetical protein